MGRVSAWSQLDGGIGDPRLRFGDAFFVAAHGMLMINSGAGALSTPMSEREIDHLAEEMLAGLRKVRGGLAGASTGAPARATEAQPA